jgi:hypothetical protein
VPPWSWTARGWARRYGPGSSSVPGPVEPSGGPAGRPVMIPPYDHAAGGTQPVARGPPDDLNPWVAYVAHGPTHRGGHHRRWIAKAGTCSTCRRPASVATRGRARSGRQCHQAALRASGLRNESERRGPGAVAPGPRLFVRARPNQAGTRADLRRRVTRTLPAPTRTSRPPPTARPIPCKPVKAS